MNIINFLTAVSMPAAGLNELWSTILSNWITPLYLAAVAVFAIMFLKDRAWTKLIGFVGIAAVVGVLIFAGKALFGGENASLTKVAKEGAKQINSVVVGETVHSVGTGFDTLDGHFN